MAAVVFQPCVLYFNPLPTNRLQIRSRQRGSAVPPRKLSVNSSTASTPPSPAPSRAKPFRVDPKDPIFHDKAKFAVDKFNRKKKTNLQLVKVVGATFNPANGTCYHLSLEVKEAGDNIPMLYRAKVWETHDGVRLLDFDPIFPDENPHVPFPSMPKYDYIGPYYKMDQSSRDLVDKLAKFAFSTYIEGEDFDLQFVEAFEAKCNEVTLSRGGRGTMYSMFVKILDHGREMTYLARIFKNGDDDSLELEDFIPYF